MNHQDHQLGGGKRNINSNEHQKLKIQDKTTTLHHHPPEKIINKNYFMNIAKMYRNVTQQIKIKTFILISLFC
jgi:hypothetical protein